MKRKKLALREFVGLEPDESILELLLQENKMNVELAAQTYFENLSSPHTQPPQPQSNLKIEPSKSIIVESSPVTINKTKKGRKQSTRTSAAAGDRSNEGSNNGVSSIAIETKTTTHTQSSLPLELQDIQTYANPGVSSTLIDQSSEPSFTASKKMPTSPSDLNVDLINSKEAAPPASLLDSEAPNMEHPSCASALSRRSSLSSNSLTKECFYHTHCPLILRDTTRSDHFLGAYSLARTAPI